jgi:hypothetical protein
MPIFPETIPIQDLEPTNPEYNIKTIKRHEALYKGGESFQKMAREFLFQREIEKIRPELYNQRLNRTPVTPHAAVVDYLVSAVMKKEPVVTGPSDYWTNLNTDADGDGTDLAVLARHLLLESLLHGRSWLEVYFDEDYIPDSDTDIDSPSTDARLQVVPACYVDDWGEGFARVHTKDLERDGIWGPMTRETERWTFLTNEVIAQYQYIREKTGIQPVDRNATLFKLEEHDLGICPLIKLEISHPGMWVLNRIESNLIQLYNRESALQFALDQGCYSLLVLNLNTTDISKVYASEVAALKLAVGEDAKFISPETAIYEAAMSDLERSRTELARAVHGLSLEAAAKTQSPRATGVATKIQQGPLEALLQSYAAPVKDCLIKAFTAIAEMRNEDPSKVILSGMDEFSGEMPHEFSSPDGESDDPAASNESAATSKEEM